MAGGVNHAKQIVMDDADNLSNDLQNGDAGNLEKIGELLSLHTKMLKPMFMNEFVTVEDCAEKHKTNGDGITKIKIGPISIEGKLSTALVQMFITVMCCGTVIFAVGKAEGWW